MALTKVYASVTTSFLSHDSWSESYIGIRRIAYEILPSPPLPQCADDGALCRLALVGANHLVEVALFKVLLSETKSGKYGAQFSEAKIADVSYWEMLTKWMPQIFGIEIDVKSEPFLSSERLRKRRNDTIHKISSIATVQMARSALYSAVQTSREIYKYAGTSFPYEVHVNRYAQVEEPLFSSVSFPINT